MTSRERVIAILKHEIPDRVPYDITPYGNGLSGFNRQAAAQFRKRTGSDNPDEIFEVERDIFWVNLAKTHIDLAKRYIPYHRLDNDLIYVEDPYTADIPGKRPFNFSEWGTAQIPGEEGPYDYFISPAHIANASSLNDIENYPLPDFDAAYRFVHLPDEIAGIRKQGLASVAFLAMTIFEMAWQIRSIDQLLMDFLINKDWAACLLDRLTALSEYRAAKFAESGVDIIHLGDDVGMQDRMLISPALWREWFKPRMSRIIEAAREKRSDILFFYHSDGYVEPIIPDLIEIGINALNPVQPESMDPGQLKLKFGDRMAFWGTVGIQHTLPFGTPDDVEAEVRLRIETVGKGGGLYLSPTHVIAPEVPLENLHAFVKAVKKYGRYF